MKVDSVKKTFTMVVKVRATPFQLQTKFVREMISWKVNYAVRYLENEGFITGDVGEWHCNITGLCC